MAGTVSRRSTQRAVGVPFQGQILQVQDGHRLLVAKEQGGLEATRQLINRVYILTLAIGLLLALFGGILMSSSVTRRVDAINRTSREIMAGRLQRRMPVRGINDEFDQLADNLNAMLDRIDSLIDSVRAVTDNIAHDLRTPLTRLRGRLENLARSPEISETVRERAERHHHRCGSPAGNLPGPAAHRQDRIRHPRRGLDRHRSRCAAA